MNSGEHRKHPTRHTLEARERHIFGSRLVLKPLFLWLQGQTLERWQQEAIASGFLRLDLFRLQVLLRVVARARSFTIDEDYIRLLECRTWHPGHP